MRLDPLGRRSVTGLLSLALLTSCRSKETDRSRPTSSSSSALSAATPSPVALGGDSGVANCAPGSKCFKVDQFGKLDPHGAFTAQCTGAYPDFIATVPSDYRGPFFRLAQDYPTAPVTETAPWSAFDFHKQTEVEKYANAVLEYAYDGMLQAAWRPEANSKRRWFHVPWMTAGRHPREFVYGMTDERPVSGPELGVKQGVTINNYAVGYYNAVAGYAIGQLWAGDKPDLAKATLPEGSAVVKILFTDAKAADFDGPDILDGAPTLSIYAKDRNTGAKGIVPVRLLQLDFATRDKRAGTTQWTFGTFAYDAKAVGTDPWRKMKLVGLMWGDDPALTPKAYAAGKRPVEGLNGSTTPTYAAKHLGWEDRVNGPVDNPISSCLSCHGTAQFPATAPMTWGSSGLKCSDDQKMAWFRDLSGSTPFGAIETATCTWSAPQPSDTALDFSLQTAVALGNFANKDNVNPCKPTPKPPLTIASLATPDTRRIYELER